MLPKFIALEEHFQASLPGGLKTFSGPVLKVSREFFVNELPMLADVASERTSHMDAGNVRRQVVSHVTMLLNPEQCRAANDQLAAAVAKAPDRFSGFAVLPVADPDEAAAELRRCVGELGFVGALIDNHANGKFYDGPEYDVLWRTAQELDVVVYLHPCPPTEKMTDALYSGSFPLAYSIIMGTYGWGWHSEVGIHVLHLYAGGVFDRFPRLKIVVGHFGSILPFMLSRIKWSFAKAAQDVQPKRQFQTVWDENIWITTSGVWSVDPMATILRNTKIDHILFSVDYPFSPAEDGLRFMEDLQKSGLVNEEQLAMIAYKNAQKLLNVQ